MQPNMNTDTRWGTKDVELHDLGEAKGREAATSASKDFQSRQPIAIPKNPHAFTNISTSLSPAATDKPQKKEHVVLACLTKAWKAATGFFRGPPIVYEQWNALSGRLIDNHPGTEMSAQVFKEQIKTGMKLLKTCTPQQKPEVEGKLAQLKEKNVELRKKEWMEGVQGLKSDYERLTGNLRNFTNGLPNLGVNHPISEEIGGEKGLLKKLAGQIKSGNSLRGVSPQETKEMMDALRDMQKNLEAIDKKIAPDRPLYDAIQDL